MTPSLSITAFIAHVRETQDGVTEESLAADVDALIHAGKMIAALAINLRSRIATSEHVNARILDAGKLTRFFCEAVDEVLCDDAAANALIRASAMDFLAGKGER